MGGDQGWDGVSGAGQNGGQGAGQGRRGAGPVPQGAGPGPSSTHPWQCAASTPTSSPTRLSSGGRQRCRHTTRSSWPRACSTTSWSRPLVTLSPVTCAARPRPGSGERQALLLATSSLPEPAARPVQAPFLPLQLHPQTGPPRRCSGERAPDGVFAVRTSNPAPLPSRGSRVPADVQVLPGR